MNYLNLILITLIFVSLAVVLGVFGRSLKRVKQINPAQKVSTEEGKRFFLVRFFLFLWSSLTGMFVFIAEWLVKKFKNILHLVHFWLIKTKKGKKSNGVIDEAEAKKELISEEEKSLDNVINDSLEKTQDSLDEEIEEEKDKVHFSIKEAAEKPEKKQEEVSISFENEKIEEETEEEQKEDFEQERGNKVANFFLSRKSKKQEKSEEEELFEQEEFVQDESDVEEEEKQTFSQKIKESLNIFSRFKREKKDVDFVEEEEAQFSDGVVKIQQKMDSPSSENLIQEVAPPNKKSREDYDPDEDLGVDRKILEKKILQKIAKEPKNVEHYRQLGELYIKMKNFEDANDAYKFILHVSARDADAKRKIEKIKLLKRLS